MNIYVTGIILYWTNIEEYLRYFEHIHYWYHSILLKMYSYLKQLLEIF